MITYDLLAWWCTFHFSYLPLRTVYAVLCTKETSFVYQANEVSFISIRLAASSIGSTSDITS